jgi:hypothetical protein
MKTMKKLLLLALAGVAAFTACDKGGDEPPPKEGDDAIEISPKEKIQTAFADEETTGELNFTAKAAWSIDVNEPAATRAKGVAWIRLYIDGVETYSGDAGEIALEIIVDPNYSGKAREADIVIRSGGAEVIVWVTQAGTTESGKIPEEPINVFDYISDPVLKAKIQENMRISGIAGWENDQLSIEDAKLIKRISFPDRGFKPTSLEGLEYFPDLTYLYISGSPIRSIDLSMLPALETLYCANCPLTELNVLKNTALTVLDCSYTSITELDVSNNPALIWLNCHTCPITELDVSNNPALTELDCHTCPITELDVSNNTALTYLDCNYSEIAELNISNNTALTYLDCSYSVLAELDTSNNTALTYLDCSYSVLAELNTSNNAALTYLDCSFTKLTELDISNNTALTYLNCFHHSVNNKMFTVKAWFDNDNIPDNFTNYMIDYVYVVN